MSVLPGAAERMGGVSAPNQSAPPVLYTGIVLYSAEDPEASAMLVADGLIAWTGPEDSALVLHPEAERVDATGCLVTPGFVDAAATADGTDPDPAGDAAAARRGIVLRLPGPTGMREGVQVIAPVTGDADYLGLVGEGTPLAFGSAGRAGTEPWSWVRAAAHTAPAAHRISDAPPSSPRAAAGGGWPAAAIPAPCAPPARDLRGVGAVDLTVRSLAEGVDSWSTDPRSHPLLPDSTRARPVPCAP